MPQIDPVLVGIGIAIIFIVVLIFIKFPRKSTSPRMVAPRIVPVGGSITPADIPRPDAPVPVYTPETVSIPIQEPPVVVNDSGTPPADNVSTSSISTDTTTTNTVVLVDAPVMTSTSAQPTSALVFAPASATVSVPVPAPVYTPVYSPVYSPVHPPVYTEQPVPTYVASSPDTTSVAPSYPVAYVPTYDQSNIVQAPADNPITQVVSSTADAAANVVATIATSAADVASSVVSSLYAVSGYKGIPNMTLSNPQQITFQQGITEINWARNTGFLDGCADTCNRLQSCKGFIHIPEQGPMVQQCTFVSDVAGQIPHDSYNLYVRTAW